MASEGSQAEVSQGLQLTGDGRSMARGMVIGVLGAILMQLAAYIQGVDVQQMLGVWSAVTTAVVMAIINTLNEFVRKGVFTRESLLSAIRGAGVAGIGAAIAYASAWLSKNPQNLDPTHVAFYTSLVNMIRLWWTDNTPMPPEDPESQGNTK